MVNQQLLDYVKERLQQGATREQIQTALLNEGWQEQDIDEAFNSSALAVRPVGLNNASHQASDFQPAAKKTSKIFPLVISIIGGLAIAGGGVFAYFNYFPAPEKVLEKMRLRIAEIKSFEFSGQVDSEIKMGDYLKKKGNSMPSVPLLSSGKDTKISIKIDGLFDKNDVKNPKAAVDLNLETDLIPMIKLAVGLKARVIGKAVYLQLKDLPNLGFFDLSKANNQWIKFNNKSLEQKGGAVNYEKQVNEMIKGSELTAEQKEKISSLFKKINYIKITKKLPSEKIEGVSTYHYSYIMDREGLKQFYIEAMKITKPEMLTADFIAKLNKSLDILGSINGEVWIGKKDFFPYKITFELNMTETETSPAGKINSVFSLKNFNKPTQIEAPVEVKSLQEISAKLFSGLKGFSPTISRATTTQQNSINDMAGAVDTDKDGLSDTDGDGFKDGDEVKNGFNPKGAGKLDALNKGMYNTEEKCTVVGGRWRVGPGDAFCVLPASDYGKICSDGSDCEGDCVAELTADEEKKLTEEFGKYVLEKTGKCSQWQTTFGCFPRVSNGKVEGILCAD